MLMFLFVSLSLLVDICRHGRRKIVVLRHFQTSHGGRLFDSGIGGSGLDQEGKNSSVAATKGSRSKDSQRDFFGVVASCWSGMGCLSGVNNITRYTEFIFYIHNTFSCTSTRLFLNSKYTSTG
jgi:hypothetical protein